MLIKKVKETLATSAAIQSLLLAAVLPGVSVIMYYGNKVEFEAALESPLAKKCMDIDSNNRVTDNERNRFLYELSREYDTYYKKWSSQPTQGFPPHRPPLDSQLVLIENCDH